ncbi:MAG TPA: TatD family hydrolase [Tepidiformaceae bacterium]|nr:TatD family hydrolase [Tepidiformaceae bacterium]
MPEPWIDTHVHFERYEPADRARMLDEARAAGVGQLLAVSTTMASSRRTVELDEPVLKAVGVHPMQAHGLDIPALKQLAKADGVVAIGEIGFDGNGPGRSVQGMAFEQQAAIARELDLAVLLHVDGPNAWYAFEGAAAMLDGARVIRHYFTGDAAQLAFHVAHGHYVSFGRPLLRDDTLQVLARTAPLELLVIETDSYPLPGRTTEPRHLVEVAQLLARLRSLEPDVLAARLADNTRRALNLAH